LRLIAFFFIIYSIISFRGLLMPVTLKDIADRTGVSPSVVSTVLSGRDNGTFVSKETRERVMEVARDLNYTPVRSGRPRGSRRLRSQHVEQFIGVWTPESDPSLVLSIQVLQQALTHYASQREIVSGATYDYGLRLLTEADLPKLDMIGIMGMIILGDSLLPRSAAAATLPVVMMGETDDLPREIVSVHTDHFAAGRLLGDHLWKLDHRRIAFIAPSSKPSSRVTRQRWQGIQSVWVEQSAPADWCIPAPYDAFHNLNLREQVEKAVSAVLNSPNRNTAIVCSSETIAFFTLQTLATRGISVPSQMSVAVFGDSPNLAEAAIPPLTAIHSPSTQIATTAIAQLYTLHSESEEPHPFMHGEHHRDISYPGHLVIRSSTSVAASHIADNTA
jgi:LacI family transcriptional regulator